MLFQTLRKGRDTLKMGRAFIRLVQDPNRLDEVFDMADAMDRNEEVIQPILEAFAATESGAAGLRNQPRVVIDMPYLKGLPEGTLGRAFATFVEGEGIDPASLFRDRPVADEKEWLFEHLFETHDIWHVVTGFGTDVAGELGLQAFYLAQFPARLGNLLIAAGLLNTFLFRFDDRIPRMGEIAKGWTMGRQAQPLLGIDWTSLWDRKLEDVRRELAITAADLTRVSLAA